MADRRVAWVDYAKGICLLAVVSMYSTFYVEGLAGTEGWMHHWVEFAKPFRMPDFFLLSGLFLAKTIDRPWRAYLDKKIVHFAYFFALWTSIYFAAAALKGEFDESPPLWLHYLSWYVEPFHMLWFIAMLPVFFLVTRLVRPVPWAIVLTIAVLLQLAHPETGFRQLDRFSERFVYFYTGYIFAPYIFVLARCAATHTVPAIGAILAWAIVNELVVLQDLSEKPVVSLVLGLAGALGIAVIGSLLSKYRAMDWLRYLGEHSIVIFLSFFFAMVIASRILWSLGVVPEVGTLALIVTLISVFGPIALYWGLRSTPFRFLFERPGWAALDSKRVTAAPVSTKRELQPPNVESITSGSQIGLLEGSGIAAQNISAADILRRESDGTK